MRNIWLFNLVLCIGLTVVSPQGASGKHTVLTFPDFPCFDNLQGLVLQEATFSQDLHRYKLTGICSLKHTRLALLVDVPYTIVGTYNPKTGDTTEVIDVPAPAINQPSRPYGRFESTKACNMDPWLNTHWSYTRWTQNQAPWLNDAVQCSTRQATANPPANAYGPGPVGDYARTLFNDFRTSCTKCLPYSALASEQVWQPLGVQYQAFLAAEKKADQILQGAKQPSSPYTALIYPSVLEPKAGQIFAPQRPVSIKLAPPKGWRVNDYTVIIQRKESNGTWVNHTTIPITAIVAHSPTGYTGFGGGAPPAFLMLPGKWRLSAQVSSPKQSGVSEWIEFSAIASADFAAPKRKTPLPF